MESNAYSTRKIKIMNKKSKCGISREVLYHFRCLLWKDSFQIKKNPRENAIKPWVLIMNPVHHWSKLFNCPLVFNKLDSWMKQIHSIKLCVIAVHTLVFIHLFNEFIYIRTNWMEVIKWRHERKCRKFIAVIEQIRQLPNEIDGKMCVCLLEKNETAMQIWHLRNEFFMCTIRLHIFVNHLLILRMSDEAK